MIITTFFTISSSVPLCGLNYSTNWDIDISKCVSGYDPLVDDGKRKKTRSLENVIQMWDYD